MANPSATSPFDNIFQQYAGSLASDPTFLAIVGAGSYAESGWDTSKVGDNGHSVGIFQLNDQGLGAGLSVAQRQDVNISSSILVPRYASAYNLYKNSYSGADLASIVAASAERPLGWDNPASAARQNYRNAWQYVISQVGGIVAAPNTGTTGSTISTGSTAPSETGSTSPTQTSLNFGDSLQFLGMQAGFLIGGLVLLALGVYLLAAKPNVVQIAKDALK